MSKSSTTSNNCTFPLQVVAPSTFKKLSFLFITFIVIVSGEYAQKYFSLTDSPRLIFKLICSEEHYKFRGTLSRKLDDLWS